MARIKRRREPGRLLSTRERQQLKADLIELKRRLQKVGPNLPEILGYYSEEQFVSPFLSPFFGWLEEIFKFQTLWEELAFPESNYGGNSTKQTPFKVSWVSTCETNYAIRIVLKCRESFFTGFSGHLVAEYVCGPVDSTLPDDERVFQFVMKWNRTQESFQLAMECLESWLNWVTLSPIGEPNAAGPSRDDPNSTPYDAVRKTDTLGCPKRRGRKPKKSLDQQERRIKTAWGDGKNYATHSECDSALNLKPGTTAAALDRIRKFEKSTARRN